MFKAFYIDICSSRKLNIFNLIVITLRFISIYFYDRISFIHINTLILLVLKE